MKVRSRSPACFAMHNQISAKSIPEIIESPTPEILQQAVQWLADNSHENLELERGLDFIFHNNIAFEQIGGKLAIAMLNSEISGVLIVEPNQTNASLEASDRITAQMLFKVLQSRGVPKRVFTSKHVKNWVHPLLLENYRLCREYDQIVMICTEVPNGGEGRWAKPEDKEWLQAYEAAYIAERGSGSLNRNWDLLIAAKQIAVLEKNGEIVSVVKRGRDTTKYAGIFAPLTFAKYRRQGFGYKLLAFFIGELLQERPAVHLWLDEDNTVALALYNSLGFQQIGQCYTGYFSEKGLVENGSW